MPVPTALKDISVSPASNSPAGADNVGPLADDYLRGIQATFREGLAHKGADIASATTTDIGAVPGRSHNITGSATITSFGTVSVGIRKTLWFTGSPLITYHATNLILPGEVNYVASPGDRMEVESLGGGAWRCFDIVRKQGTPVFQFGLPGSIGADCRNNSGSPSTLWDMAARSLLLYDEDAQSNLVYKHNPGTLTNNIALTGPAAGGRDMVGAFPANSWIHSYWIWNGTTLSTVTSLNPPPAGPVMPTGYTHWTYGHALRLDASGLLLRMRGKADRVFYDAPPTAGVGLNATSETALGGISTAIPPNCLSYQLGVSSAVVQASSGGAVDADMFIRVVSGTNFTRIYTITLSGLSAFSATKVSGIYVEVPNVNQTLFYYWVISSGSSQSASLEVPSFAIPNGG